MTRSRAFRRHHVERLKQTRFCRYLEAGWSREQLERIRGRLDDVWGPRSCSCGICRKPRARDERHKQ